MESKKHKKADLGKKSGLFFNIGLFLSVLIVLVAFEWKSYDDGAMVDLGQRTDDFEDLMEIPPTEQPPPPPPKIQQPEIIEVPDEEEIEEEIEVDLDVEITEDQVIEDIIVEEAPAEEKVEEIFTIVEDPATFPGGRQAFYKYVADKLKYPAQARRMGIEGKVFVQFVVNENGELTEVKAIKGIGAGCDEEAVRVIQNSPKWNPPKQRGKPVKQRIILPIVFKLG
ncbi:MAG: TonB family protein [Fulvivirga sp.]|nr:TonB family protein [Fulvivirga sp.]